MIDLTIQIDEVLSNTAGSNKPHLINNRRIA